MSTTTILVAGATATFGIPLASVAAVAFVASPINRARDARRISAETQQADLRTTELVVQIRRGADYAALVDPEPGKLAAAAYAVAAGLARVGHPEDLPFMLRVFDELRPILAAEQVAIPHAVAMPPIQAAAALQLLLHRLREACDSPQRVRVSIAAGALAEAIRALPDGCVVDFNPLTEHDPVWFRRAQAEWVAVAERAGMGGWERALHA